jgi:hypothetical protein
MKSFLVIAVFLCGGLGAQAARRGGVHIEDGGAGIAGKNGVLTVAEGKIPFLKKPEALEEIPGLSLLLRQIKGSSLQRFFQTDFLSALVPAPNRFYHRIEASAIPPEVGEKLRRGSEPTYTATDVAAHTTILFPDFYQIKKPSAQAEVLFGEALSFILGDVGEDGTKVANLFQQLQEKPGDAALFYAFYKGMLTLYRNRAEAESITVYAGLKFDMKNNGAFAPSQKLRMKDVFGGDFLKCWFANPEKATACRQLLAQTDSRPSALKENSLFVRGLQDYLETDPRLGPPFLPAVVERFHLRDPQAMEEFLDHLFFTAEIDFGGDIEDLQIWYDAEPIFTLKF